MDLSQVLKQCQHLAQPYRIHDGGRFKLEQIDPGDTQDLPADKAPIEWGIQRFPCTRLSVVDCFAEG